VKNTQSAFTLIELLVVIAIIAMLLSILMPALGRAKDQARSVVCRSNLKQWGLIWKLYTDDYNSSFSDPFNFPVDYTPAGKYPRGQWIVGLREYIEEDLVKILICPSASKEWSDTTTDFGATNYAYRSGAWVAGGGAELASYGFNCWSYSPRPGRTNPVKGVDHLVENHWRKMDAVTSAGRVPLMADCAVKGGWPTYNAGDNIVDCTLPPVKPMEIPGDVDNNNCMSVFTMDRHIKSINMVFMDLSVAKVPLKHLWKQKWHKNFNTSGYTKHGGEWKTTAEWMESYKE
jgi:prepilin-type N-terminal cleavage/methylation domain-containing protein